MAYTIPSTTKGVRVTGKRKCEVIQRQTPNAQDDFVLIKVRIAAMCNEHNAYRDGVFIWGETPDRLGHEIAGEIVDTGRSTKFKVGDRVIANMHFYSCGRCHVCRSGSLALCGDPDKVDQWLPKSADLAGFAQYSLRGDWTLIPIPDDLSYHHAACAMCGCGPAYSALEEMNVGGDLTVLVTGLGPVGLGCVMMAKARGARVIGIGRQAYRRDLALKLGADAVLDTGDGQVLQKIRDLTQDRGVEAAVECSAQATYLRLAIDATAIKGQITVLGETGDFQLNLLNDLIQFGRVLNGRVDVTNARLGRVMEIFRRMPKQLDTFITHTFALDNIEQAWQVQNSRLCGKVLLDPWA